MNTLFRSSIYRFTLMLMLIICTANRSSAQFTNCRVVFTTVINGKFYSIESSQAFLVYSSKSGDISLRVKLSSINAEPDTLNRYFSSSNEELVFTGNLGTGPAIFDLVDGRQNSNSSLPLQGTLDLNHLSLATAASFRVFKISNEREEMMRNIRMSLAMNFRAKDFGLQRYYAPLTGDINLQVTEGIVNIIEE
jgi:polyisoprenoid-binding protein YceI